MIPLLLLTILFLVPVKAHAQLVRDAATSMAGLTSTSGNATIAADATIALVCVAERDSNTSGFTANASATVGGQAATLLASLQNGDNLVRVNLFYKLAPATGTVAVAVTADTGTDVMMTSVVTYKGVAQTSTFNTPSTNSSTSSANMDVDSIASAVGEVVVMCGSIRAASQTPSPDATVPVSEEVIDAAHPGGTSVRNVFYEEAGAASTVNMRVDLTGEERWAAIAVSLRPLASAASFGPLSRRRQ